MFNNRPKIKVVLEISKARYILSGQMFWRAPLEECVHPPPKNTP